MNVRCQMDNAQNIDDFDDRMGGLSDDELLYRFREAIRIENEIKRIKGVPIAGYDVTMRKPYLEYPDGHREYHEET